MLPLKVVINNTAFLGGKRSITSGGLQECPPVFRVYKHIFISLWAVHKPVTKTSIFISCQRVFN